jgi:hypothetical protein
MRTLRRSYAISILPFPDLIEVDVDGIECMVKAGQEDGIHIVPAARCTFRRMPIRPRSGSTYARMSRTSSGTEDTSSITFQAGVPPEKVIARYDAAYAFGFCS